MKRLIIICEGPTHSNGGIVAWDTLRKQIVRHLNEGNSIVSLFVDYYRIRDSYHFPGWMESKSINNIYDRMHFLFEQMSLDIEENLRSRFIPYIQLHEFEGLLFSNIAVFQNNFTKQELDFQQLEDAINSVKTPEEINNGPATAPSERLKKAIKGYDKVVYGACLASDIGLNTIREKCILFNEWVMNLETC